MAGSLFGQYRLVMDQAALNDLLNSKQGPVARELLRKGAEVDGYAKQLLNGVMVNVISGRLKGSTTHVLATKGGQIAVFVGSGAFYGAIIHKRRPYLVVAAGRAGLTIRETA